MFLVRLPFTLPQGLSIALSEGKESFAVSGIDYELEALDDRRYLLWARGFATEDEALEWLPRMAAALEAMSITEGLPLEVQADPGSITRTKDRIEAGRNLAKAFGLDFQDPVDGIGDGDRALVYDAHEAIKVVLGFPVSFVIGKASANVIEALEEFLSIAQLALPTGRLRTAFDLFRGHRHEYSREAKFLTLVMCLEALATPETRHESVLNLLERWNVEASEAHSNSRDENERDALNELRTSMFFAKRSSIKAQIRSLVLKSYSDPNKAKERARDVSKLYDWRSRLVHNGFLEDAKISEALPLAETLVREVLESNLRQQWDGGVAE